MSKHSGCQSWNIHIGKAVVSGGSFSFKRAASWNISPCGELVVVSGSHSAEFAVPEAGTESNQPGSIPGVLRKRNSVGNKLVVPSQGTPGQHGNSKRLINILRKET